MPVIRASVAGTLQRLIRSWLPPATLNASLTCGPNASSETAANSARAARAPAMRRPRSREPTSANGA